MRSIYRDPLEMRFAGQPSKQVPGFKSPLSRSKPGTAPSALIGFYTNFWKLADLTDSIGSLTLTNANAVSFGPGKIGNAATFVAASFQSLGTASGNFTGPKFTISMWFKLTGIGAQRLFTWNNNNAGSVNVQVNGGSGAGKLLFFTDLNASKYVETTVNTYNDGNWHLVIAYHDGSGNNVIILDNGSPITLAATADVTSGPSHVIQIGTDFSLSAYVNGMIDAIGIADNKIPSAAQITAMWNAGAGVEPPF